MISRPEVVALREAYSAYARAPRDEAAADDIRPLVCHVVDVMKADHHGSWDANGISMLANLRPRVIVVDSRADGHPAVDTYERMTSRKLWPGDRDIFVTNVSPATSQTTYGIEKAMSTQGHIVIRVAPGGVSYRIFVLEDDDEEMRVKAVFGTYESR